MRRLLLAGLCLAGCLDDPEVSQTAQSETVLEEPAPYASCSSGCFDGRVAGEPVRVFTSYEGLCKLLGEYSCHEQDYTATVTCSTPCTGAGTQSFHGHGSFDIVPTTAGALTFSVRIDRATPVFNDHEAVETTTLTVAGGVSYTPDHIAVACTQRHGLACDPAALNLPPIEIDLELYAGQKRLVTTRPFYVESSLPGEQWNASEWATEEGGRLELTAWYGVASSAPLVLDVAYDHPAPDYAGDAPTSSSMP